jgi:hypothetical protein
MSRYNPLDVVEDICIPVRGSNYFDPSLPTTKDSKRQD